MDLISISRAVWRHKLAIIPVILLTLLGAFYILAVKPPVYQASSSLLFLSPPNPPTPAQIAANPRLAKVDPSNPYGNLGVVWTADAVVGAVAGEVPQAQVTLSTNPNNPPIIEIRGTGSSPQAAVNAAELATAKATADLYQMQALQGVTGQYMIKAIQLVQPDQASQTVSGKFRSLIAVLALGIILLFVTVSAAQAIEKARGSHRRSVKIRPQEATTAPDGDGVWARAGVSGSSRRRHWYNR